MKIACIRQCNNFWLASNFELVKILGRNCPNWIFEGKHRARLLISADKSVNIQNILEDWLGPLKLASSVVRSISIPTVSLIACLCVQRQTIKIVNFPVQTACLSGMAMIAPRSTICLDVEVYRLFVCSKNRFFQGEGFISEFRLYRSSRAVCRSASPWQLTAQG